MAEKPPEKKGGGSSMKLREIALSVIPIVIPIVILSPGITAAQTLNCDLSSYKPVEGVKAEAKGNAVVLNWQGEAGQQLRAQFSLRDGQPLVQELAARSSGGAWIVLGKDLTPDFQVTTSKRRISGGIVSLLKSARINSPEEEDRRKWNIFWDAPLVGPGKKYAR